MSLKLTLSPLFMILFFGIIDIVGAQVIVTGHITAEVVESAHASSKLISGSDFRREKLTTALLQQKESSDKDVLNLGAVAIKSGEDVACSIKLHESVLTDNMGNFFTIQPTSVTSGRSDTMHIDGSQTLLLNGTTRIANNLSSGYYRGSLDVVVQYN